MPCYVLSQLPGMFELLEGYLHSVARKKNIVVKCSFQKLYIGLRKLANKKSFDKMLIIYSCIGTVKRLNAVKLHLPVGRGWGATQNT
jgi:hypothetical protein